MSRMALRIVALTSIGSLGVLLFSLASATGRQWPSDTHLRQQLRPDGEFVRTVGQLIDQLNAKPTNTRDCEVAENLSRMFYWLTESERKLISEDMVRKLAELLNHDVQEEKCVDIEVASSLMQIGAKARLALPVLRSRLAAENDADRAAPPPKHLLLSERNLNYLLERAIANIEETRPVKKKQDE